MSVTAESKPRQPLVPGVVSPTLPVPSSIERPEYAWKPTANEGNEPWVQTPEVIEKMRVASKIAARCKKPARRLRRVSPPTN